MTDDRWLALCARARHAPPRPLPPVPMRAWTVGPPEEVRTLRRQAWQGIVLYAAVLALVPAAGLVRTWVPTPLRTLPTSVFSTGLPMRVHGALGALLPELTP